MSLRLNGSTSGYSEIDAPAIAGNNTLVLPTTNGSAHQLLKNSGTAGTWEYGVTLPSGNGLAHQLVKNSSSAGTWEYGFTLPSGNGLADQVLGGDGAGIISWVDRSRMVLETAKAYNWNSLTTNTSIDFTSIPSWVKRVTVMMNGVSTNGSSILLVQLGDSGGVETTGYLGSVGIAVSGSAGATTSTAGFPLLHSSDAAAVVAGALTVLNVSGNSWVSSWAGARTDAGSGLAGAGTKTLSATLDRLRITTVNGTDTFDAGTINILYEG